MPNNNALALIGVQDIEWWPSIHPTPDGANRLTGAIIGVAHAALEEERDNGSDIPPLMSKTVDTTTGEITKTVNLAYEAVLRERALYYLQSLQMEADASTLQILSDIENRQLYLHHPDGWGCLAHLLKNMAAGKSASYQSVAERLTTVILPFLQVEELSSVREMMEVVTEGGMSNLYHLLPEMTMAVESGDRDQMAELLNDAKTLQRKDIWAKYKQGDIKPASATLEHTNPGWRLTIEMDEVQKQLILNRLGGRIEWTSK